MTSSSTHCFCVAKCSTLPPCELCTFQKTPSNVRWVGIASRAFVFILCICSTYIICMYLWALKNCEHRVLEAYIRRELRCNWGVCIYASVHDLWRMHRGDAVPLIEVRTLSSYKPMQNSYDSETRRNACNNCMLSELLNFHRFHLFWACELSHIIN